jgi:chromosome segregation ATPase
MACLNKDKLGSLARTPLLDLNGRKKADVTTPTCSTRATPATTKGVTPATTVRAATPEPDYMQKEAELVMREAAQFEAELKLGAREKYLRDLAEQQESKYRKLAERENQVVARESAVGDSKSKVTLSEGQADLIQRKLVEQSNKVTAAEEKIASQEMMIQQLTSALAKAREARSFPDPDRAPKQTEEKATVELAAVRLELQQTRQDLESKEAELDRILPEVVAGRMNGSHCVRDMEVEIERLRRELANACSEVAELRPELYQAQQALEHKEAELDRLLPEVVNCRVNGTQRLHSKDAEIEQIRQELDSVRVELACKDVDLQQARQDLEAKKQELHDILAEAATTRTRDLQEMQSKDAETDRLRRELALSRALDVENLQNRDAEMDRLWRELEDTRAELVSAQAHAKTESSSNVRSRSVAAEAGPVDFQRAQAQMERYLERREQDIAQREALFTPRCSRVIRPSASVSAPLYSAAPTVPRGSLWDRLNFDQR